MFTKREKKTCDVPVCPERYRCLDVETPKNCAVYRLYGRNASIASPALTADTGNYEFTCIRRADGMEFPSLRAAAADAGCGYGAFYEAVTTGDWCGMKCQKYEMIWG